MQRGRRPKRVASDNTGSQKKGRHADPPGAGSWMHPASKVVPRGRISQQINEDSLQDGEALPGQPLSQPESDGSYGAANMNELASPAESAEAGTAAASPRRTRSRTASHAVDASQGAGHSSGQMRDITQLPAIGNALEAQLPASGPNGHYDNGVCAMLHALNQTVGSLGATMVAKLTDIEEAIKKTAGSQVAITDSENVTKAQEVLFRKTLKTLMEEESVFPDDPMLERAVAHVLGCKDDVDKAREASKMIAALMKKGNKTSSSIRQDFAKVAKAAIMESFCWTEEQGKAKSWGAAPILPPARRKGGNFLVSARAERLLQDDRYRTTAPRDKTQAINFLPFRMAVAAAVGMREDPDLRMIETTPSKVAFVEQLVRRHLKGQRDIPHQADQLQVWIQEYKVLLRKTEQRMQDSAHIFTSQTLSEDEGF